MNLLRSIVTLILLSNMVACGSPKTIKSNSSKQIFHEPSQDWTTTGDAEWVLDKGVITGKGILGFAVTTQAYSNFILEAEFKPDAIVNSGIFIRCPEDVFNPTDCYEINISDNHQNQDFRTGAIVTKQKPKAIINTVDKWNNFKISAIDDHIQVWLNGTLVGDLKDDASASGVIGLQLNGEGIIQFRNVRIKEL